MPARLLIVEDEPGIEQILKGKYWPEIREGKYELIFVKTGEKALEVIENNADIDLIITDLKMPASKIDGPALIHILRKRHINIKIIVLTAYKHEYKFSEQDQKNILFFLDKISEEEDSEKPKALMDSSLTNSSVVTLKNLVALSLEFPDHLEARSQKVRLDTLVKVIKDLTESKKEKLFLKLLDYLPYTTLKWLQEELPKKIEKLLEKSYRQQELHKWLLKKQKESKIPLDVPLDRIEYFFIEARYLNNNLYYYLKWSEYGHWHSKYLAKKVIENELPLDLRTQIQGSYNISEMNKK